MEELKKAIDELKAKVKALEQTCDVHAEELKQEIATAETAYKEVDERLSNLEHNFGRVESLTESNTNELYGMRYGRYDDERI